MSYFDEGRTKEKSSSIRITICINQIYFFYLKMHLSGQCDIGLTIMTTWANGQTSDRYINFAWVSRRRSAGRSRWKLSTRPPPYRPLILSYFNRATLPPPLALKSPLSCRVVVPSIYPQCRPK